MKTKTLTSLLLKRLFKDPSFRQKHPQFSSLYAAIDNDRRGRKKCCGKTFTTQTYNMCVDVIKRNKKLFKDYLKVDQLEVFVGSPKRLIII